MHALFLSAKKSFIILVRISSGILAWNIVEEQLVIIQANHSIDQVMLYLSQRNVDMPLVVDWGSSTMIYSNYQSLVCSIREKGKFFFPFWIQSVSLQFEIQLQQGLAAG